MARSGAWKASIDMEDSVPLDLQAALHQAYDAANDGKYIYEGQPQPPLRADDAAWATAIVGRVHG